MGVEYRTIPELQDQSRIYLSFNNNVAVSFNNDIIRTGTIVGSHLDDDSTLYIKLDSDDALIKSMAAVYDVVAAEMMNDALLDRDHWTFEDRLTWEKKLTQTVSEKLSTIEGLNTYRSSGMSNPDVKRTSYLNDLAEDIETGKQIHEFDCEQMSIIEGIIVQQVENDLLLNSGFRRETASPDNYKYGGNYFYMCGGRVDNMDEKLVGGHAFVMSFTGAINESVESGSDMAFRRPLQEHSFERLIAGENLPYMNSDLFSVHFFNSGQWLDHASPLIEERWGLMENGNFKALKDKQIDLPTTAGAMKDFEEKLSTPKNLNEYFDQAQNLMNKKLETSSNGFFERSTLAAMLEDAAINDGTPEAVHKALDEFIYEFAEILGVSDNEAKDMRAEINNIFERSDDQSKIDYWHYIARDLENIWKHKDPQPETKVESRPAPHRRESTSTSPRENAPLTVKTLSLQKINVAENQGALSNIFNQSGRGDIAPLTPNQTHNSPLQSTPEAPKIELTRLTPC